MKVKMRISNHLIFEISHLKKNIKKKLVKKIIFLSKVQ